MNKLATLATALVVLTAGCGGDGRTGGSGQGAGGAAPKPPASCLDVSGQSMVEIVSAHNDYTPECLVVSPDQRIRVDNTDLVRHSFTVSQDDIYHTPFLVDIDEIEGGKKATTDAVGGFLQANDPNPFFCKYHAGMEGELWLVS